VSGFDKAEIYEKISETEKILNSAIEELKSGLANKDSADTEGRFNDIVREIKELKDMTSEFRKGGHGQTEKGKKKNLWTKIFD
jgi:hypothetical protein